MATISAELVEKAIRAVRIERLSQRSRRSGLGLDERLAQAVLSALSGDLVPRERCPECDAPACRTVEWITTGGEDLSPAVFLHCSRCGWDPDDAKPARSQADALAEALEAIVGDKTPVADFHFAGRADDREDAMIEIARSALASYRSSSSTETEDRA